jgi:uncharacterized protein YlxW (UPF0749 family)
MGRVTGPVAQQTSRRPDASMSLLTALLGQSLDPGYAEASRRRAAQPARPRRPRLLLLVGLVAIGAVLAAAALQTRVGLPASERARAMLVDQVQQRSDAADALVRHVATLQADVAKAQREALALTAAGRAEASRLAALEMASGVAPVTGPGLRVSIDNAASSATSGNGDPRTTGEPSEGTVRDRDLQQVVNGLWAAGAEAIAVDGHRLSSLSAIRAAGQAILIDYRAVTPPYVIEAIGQPGRLEAGFAASAGGAYLQTIATSFGIRYDIGAAKRLDLPGAAGQRLDTARPPQEGS